MEYEDLSLVRENGDIIQTIDDYFPNAYALLAGLIAGGNFCLYQIPDYHGEYFEITVKDPYRQLNWRRNYKERADNITFIDQGPDTKVDILLTNIPRSQISKYFTLEYIENFQYALWIETGQYDDDEDGNENPIVDLYGFSDFESLQEFIQGLLTMVHAFNVSYEECIVHCPFDRNGHSYAIEGYRLPILRPSVNEYNIFPLDEAGIMFEEGADNYNPQDYEAEQYQDENYQDERYEGENYEDEGYKNYR